MTSSNGYREKEVVTVCLYLILVISVMVERICGTTLFTGYHILPVSEQLVMLLMVTSPNKYNYYQL